MARVRWLPEALGDIERLYQFLMDKDANAASRAAGCILDGAELIVRNPRIGRHMGDETDRRELFVAFGAGAYVLRYTLLNSSTVVIIRVWHSRENLG